MTHMIPRVLDAIEPWLREKVQDPRFWEDKYDATHVGEFPLDCMTEEDAAAALERFSEMPNPLSDKTVIVVKE